jgi:hypothetical protein
MIDTVGLSCHLEGIDTDSLEQLGWGVKVTRTHRGDETVERTKAFLTIDNGMTLEYLADMGWLTVRASLPRILGLQNDVVLSWPDTVRALAVATGDLASHLVGDRLPPLRSWALWRFDPVWAWPCDPAPYIDALRIARLPRTQAVCEPGSVRWRSLRSGAIFGRFYDKSREAGRRVDLPCRLELQARPKRQVIRVEGQRVRGEVGELTETTCRGAVIEAAHRLGLTRPIPSVAASRAILTDFWGPRKGNNLWRELLAYEVCGGWPAGYADKKIRRIERDLRQAGIAALSTDGELPPLEF